MSAADVRALADGRRGPEDPTSRGVACGLHLTRPCSASSPTLSPRPISSAASSSPWKRAVALARGPSPAASSPRPRRGAANHATTGGSPMLRPLPHRRRSPAASTAGSRPSTTRGRSSGAASGSLARRRSARRWARSSGPERSRGRRSPAAAAAISASRSARRGTAGPGPRTAALDLRDDLAAAVAGGALAGVVRRRPRGQRVGRSDVLRDVLSTAARAAGHRSSVGCILRA